jgi:UDP-N-acetyl-D-mannosaminuronic acid transferase (WecB/TagA/CpsF family)
VQILGLDFFEENVTAAVDRALHRGGLIVAPSGTCFRRLQRDKLYRHAMRQADLVLPDSGFMVLLWRVLRWQQLSRISGLAYLTELLGRRVFRQDRSALWVLPDDHARDVALGWLQDHGFLTTADDCYVAPMYGTRVEDPVLLDRVRSQHAAHVVIALSGGVQEKLGFYLRENAGGALAIHCIGAALGFVTGYQVAIPAWADRLYLGWFLRLLSNPQKFFPRALSAFALPRLIIKYGTALPPLQEHRG